MQLSKHTAFGRGNHHRRESLHIRCGRCRLHTKAMPDENVWDVQNMRIYMIGVPMFHSAVSVCFSSLVGLTDELLRLGRALA